MRAQGTTPRRQTGGQLLYCQTPRREGAALITPNSTALAGRGSGDQQQVTQQDEKLGVAVDQVVTIVASCYKFKALCRFVCS
jgi:hypothetical protein